MRANRRWHAKRKRLAELPEQDAAAERKVMQRFYWAEIKRRVHRLDAPSAWQLAERVKEYLDIDLTDELVDLLQQVTKPTQKPKRTRGTVSRNAMI